MSNVVPFKQNKSKKISVRKPNDTGRILFYTGIRYMRDEPVEAVREERRVESSAAVSVTERLQA